MHAVFLAYFLQRRLRLFPVRPFFGARATKNLVSHVRVHEFDGFFAPDPQGVLNILVGDFFITLADDDVNRGLRADELRQRRNHDRITELGAHAAGFFQRRFHLVFHADDLELVAHVGNHAAGNLMPVKCVIVLHRLSDRQAVPNCDCCKMLNYGFQWFQIDLGRVAESSQIARDVEHRRLR